jgi:NitT/TauT family transport system permease protein
MIGSLQRLMIWAALLAAWEMAYRLIGWRSYIFPAPSHVLDALFRMEHIRTAFGNPIHTPGWPRGPAGVDLSGDTLAAALWVSTIRLAAGFFISLALGLVLGVLMWRWAWLDRFLGPLFLGMQTLPSVCWVPMAIILFGLSDNDIGIMFVLVLGSFFAFAIALRDGLATIPPVQARAGRMLGAKGWRLYWYVMLPASLPALASSLRQGFGFAWRSLMGAELVYVFVNSHGLGYLLEEARLGPDMAKVVAVMIVMVLVGMLADQWAFGPLERRVLARFGLGEKG